MLKYGNFRFMKVEAEDLLQRIFRLRYKTYVEEFGFEKAEDHPGGLETDEYEAESLHFAALNEKDEVIGAIRLILFSEKGFPIEQAAELHFDGVEKPPHNRTGEISRLTVSKDYRRRREDGRYGLESSRDKSQHRTKSYYEKKRKTLVIVLGLYQVMYHESKRRGLTHWYMITEQKMYKTLRTFGFLFYSVGEPVYYHGLRKPYLGVIKDIEKQVMAENPFLFWLFVRGLEKECRPKFGMISYCRMVIRLPHHIKKGWHYWKRRKTVKRH